MLKHYYQLFFICFLCCLSYSSTQAQVLIAGWDFQTTTNGGTAAAASPASPTSYVANFGAVPATLYLNGTNTSSTWAQAMELNGFGGSNLNTSGTSFSTVTTGASCLSVVSNSANGKFAVFAFNMSGYENLVISYATRGTASGFNTQIWEYSTNGTTWSPIQTVANTNVTTFFAQTLSTVTGLNNVSTAYVRVSFTGATNTTGNNRLDNIQFNASVVAAAPPVINSSLTATGTEGVPISTYTITATNLPTAFNATGLPSGLSVNTLNGQITGTPTVNGTFNVTISASNGSGTDNKTLVFTINPPAPVINSALTATANINSPAPTYTITATHSPTSFNATGLPPGLSINTSNGEITGTPTALGTFNVAISATNITGTGNATLVYTIYPPAPVITSALTFNGTEGVMMSTYTITASNNPTSFNATGLPSGLSVNLTNGEITGTPTVNGTFNVTISATNTGGTGNATLVMTIAPLNTPTISLDMPGFIVGGDFGLQCVQTQSTASSYSVRGNNLTNNLTITPPAGFEISLSNAPFTPTNPIQLIPTAGTVTSTPIYVRFAPTTGGATGILSLSHTSTGAIAQSVSVSGTGDITPPTTTAGTTLTLTTQTADIDGTTFTQNCYPVLSSGICYSLSPTPTTANSVIMNTGNASPFLSSISGLTPNTQYYYRSFVTYNNGALQTAYSTQASFVTLKEEPADFPTAFACGSAAATSLTLTWADATTTVTPDGYLIQWSTASYAAIADPVDGNFIANSSTSQNVAQGVQTFVMTGLTPYTHYFVKIWSYTNTGTGVDYKLVGEPQTDCTTLVYQQSGSATYTFAAGTPSPSSAPIANLTIGDIVQGNNNGTTTLITTTSASNIYAGASGTFNAGVASRTGALNTAASGSAYFEFTLTPNTGYTVTLNGLSFGSRSTSTGPQAYTLRSSLDAYGSDLATGTLLNNSVWALNTPVSLTTTISPVGTAITYRIYGYAGAGSPALSTANWRVDDINLSLVVESERVITTDSLVALHSFCEGSTINVPFTVNMPFLSGNTFNLQLSSNTGTWTLPSTIGALTGTTNGTIIGTLPTGISGSAFRVRVIGNYPAIVGSNNGLDIAINAIPPQPAPITVVPYCGSVNLFVGTSPVGTYSWFDNAAHTAPEVGFGNTYNTTSTGTFYLFDEQAGCFSAPTSATVSSVPPTLTTLATTNGTTHTAVGECLDIFGWTNYYDASNNLLFSIEKNGIVTGTIGDGTFAVSVGGNAGATFIPANFPTNYVQAANWYTMNRFWTVTPNGTGPSGQINGDVNVRFYFKNADVTAVAANVPTVTSVEDMYFYKINGTYNANPSPASNHAAIPFATAYNTNGYWQYVHSGIGSTNTWYHGQISSGNHFAEFTISQFSGGGGGASSGSGALPIVLQSLEGFKFPTYNKLVWTTAEEAGGEKFEIMRSSDNLAFEKIGEMPTKGIPSSYTFEDKNPMQDHNYYKLKMIDINGTFAYSETVELLTTTDFQYQLYPNPAAHTMQLAISGVGTDVRLKIYDAIGNEVYRTTLTDDQTLKIPVIDWAEGVYYYQIYDESATHKGKFVVNH